MASSAMRSLVAAPTTTLLGRQAAAAVASVGVRYASTLFVRYFPKEVEIAELQKLADEFQRTNSQLVKNVRVRVPTKKAENGNVISTKGYCFLDYQSQLETQDVLKALATGPAKLPSGRPTMRHSLSKDSMSVYLAPSPEDPHIVKYKDMKEKLTELIKEHGTVTKSLDGYASQGWSLGYFLTEFAEDQAAFDAARALHGQTPPGFDFALAAKANKEGMRVGSGQQGQQRQQRWQRGARQPRQQEGQEKPKEGGVDLF